MTAWMYAPSAEPMDLRFYHDGLGQDSFEEQLDALEVTYEDYEPGFGDARGIARTHELALDAFAATPSGQELSALAAASALPPQLVATPERLHAAGVLGTWSPVDRSTPQRAHLEDRLVFLREYYRSQVDQRGWYGFWDYGDVMHTYDTDRHTWRYDVGGYAWDNSELSPDLWLWTDFLRSGDAGVFRLAEAMTRHTGEVDQYHLGRFAGLGTRHNVQHFGCSAKQLRVSSAVYRRHLYFLTADERVGELLDEVACSEEALLRVDATRKVRTDIYRPDRRALAIGLGTDLGAVLGAWLTAWERHGDTDAEEKIRSALAGIGALPRGFFTGEALWDVDERRFDTRRDRIMVSHLAAVFGLGEIVTELLDLVVDPPLRSRLGRVLPLLPCHSRGADRALRCAADRHLPDPRLQPPARRARRRDGGRRPRTPCVGRLPPGGGGPGQHRLDGRPRGLVPAADRRADRDGTRRRGGLPGHQRQRAVRTLRDPEPGADRRPAAEPDPVPPAV